ncbi:hypothetical protein DRE_01108 [Drechslerella stenobrocha 248]|uniref:Uncharacterized protein n=1 Tax=Drechslerella stenobrocha 248 TaxID=1043628 RepID=W7HW39_9PEZI|nr:hypothetical protein DRE_01108 [Drechslerella stenobrocha 248]
MVPTDSVEESCGLKSGVDGSQMLNGLFNPRSIDDGYSNVSGHLASLVQCPQEGLRGADKEAAGGEFLAFQVSGEEFVASCEFFRIKDL